MKKKLCFDTTSAPSLSAGLRSGVIAYATNVPKVGPPATLWLRLGDGRVLRIGVDMHDLSGWEEIGTLNFKVVSAEDAPEMVQLPESWAGVREVQKLVFDSDECEAECGFSICSSRGEVFTVVPGAHVYTLAIEAPFHQQLFAPESDLSDYIRKTF